MNYKRGEIVLLPFPFVTIDGIVQKAHPALVISDHTIERRFDDVILAGITSQRIDDIKQTEFLIEENHERFGATGLAKTSVVRCEYIMTIPVDIIARKLGRLSRILMSKVDKKLKLSLGL
ncbi:MAG TPA: type II toxin-antitoxin system PemK/MazF family toxin [bacterium]